MQYLKLNNGVKMPILGFGTEKIQADKTRQAVIDAIDVGYRLIDTSQRCNNECEIGDAIKQSGIKREELFITSKIWIDNYSHEKCIKSFKQSLSNMDLSYMDLVLISHPVSDYYSAYSALEELYEDGLIKSIGVSNFYPDRLTDICLFGCGVPPAVNQVEVNPFDGKFLAQANMEENSVQMQAYGLFINGLLSISRNRTLNEIADKHNVSPAQVIIRWLVERSISVVTKTTDKQKMIENIDVFDFSLDEDDMMYMMDLNRNEDKFFNHYYPMEIKELGDYYGL